MSVCRFKLYNPDEMNTLSGAVCQIVQACSEGWMTVDAIDASIRNVDGSNTGDEHYADEGHWHMVSECLAVERNGSERLGEMLLPHDESLDTAAAALRGQVLQEYLSALSLALDTKCLAAAGNTAIKLKRRLYRGSGWFLVALTVNGVDFECLMAPQIAASVLDPPVHNHRKLPLPSLRDVMSGQRVSLRAELGATTLTIGDIKQLAKGDVVALDSNLSQKMTLRTASGLALARGDLGASAGKKALKILPPSTTQ